MCVSLFRFDLFHVFSRHELRQAELLHAPYNASFGLANFKGKQEPGTPMTIRSSVLGRRRLKSKLVPSGMHKRFLMVLMVFVCGFLMIFCT
jgi:hypothetical protein